MATKKKAEAAKYPIREPGPDDAIDLVGIVSAAGGGDKLGEAIGIAVEAYQKKDAGAVVQRAAVVAVTDGLHAALRDPQVRFEVKGFLYRLWNPKFSLGEGETFEERKRAEWEKLPMRAPMEIFEAFRSTENFGDFLDFFTSMLPTPTSSGDESTGSNEGTG